MEAIAEEIEKRHCVPESKPWGLKKNTIGGQKKEQNNITNIEFVCFDPCVSLDPAEFPAQQIRTYEMQVTNRVRLEIST